MYRKKRIPSFIFVIIIMALGYFSISFFLKNKALNEKLDSYKIITFKNNNLKIVNGLDFESNQFLLTENFIQNSFFLTSPFGDGRSFKKLMREEVNSRLIDIYGCYRVTGNISRIHEGIDLFVPRLTPVYPIFPVGIVTKISRNPHYKIEAIGKDFRGNKTPVMVEYGKIVRIAYPEGIESLYAHLDSVFVEKGDIVYPDTKVGLTGYTGNIKESGKASHLHLELRDSNLETFDPEDRIYYYHGGIRHFLEQLD